MQQGEKALPDDRGRFPGGGSGNEQFPQQRTRRKNLQRLHRRGKLRCGKEQRVRRGIADRRGVPHPGGNPRSLGWGDHMQRGCRFHHHHARLGREELMLGVPVKGISVAHHLIGIAKGLYERALDPETRNRPPGLCCAKPSGHGRTLLPYGRMTTSFVRWTQDGQCEIGQIRAMNSETHQAEIIRQFTLQAVPFARHQAHSVQESFDVIRDAARLDGTQSVLDAGSGPGLVCCALAPHCREITGVDVTRAMIDEAGRRAGEAGLKNTRFIEGDIAALPFQDGAFDAAVSRYVFHHLENPLAVLREMARVTRPGGRVVICDASPAAACRENYDRFEKLRDASHTSALTLEELIALGEAAYLGEASIRRFGLPMELGSLVDSSFPEGARDELRAMIRKDIGRDAYGFAAREECGKLFITFPITVVGWTMA